MGGPPKRFAPLDIFVSRTPVRRLDGDFSLNVFEISNSVLMAEINSQLVKTLRDKTNAGMMDCKRALTEANGDLEKAETILRKKGILKAEGKGGRSAKEGVVASYIHLQGKVGVLVEVNCETDFVARNDAFREFVKDITLHIAASSPLVVNREEVPAEKIEKERDIARSQVVGKPANIVEKIVEGKIDKYYSSVCLMDQVFIKSTENQTINDLVKSKISELGENIVIRRFTRYMVGEEIGAEKPAAPEEAPVEEDVKVS